MRQVLTDLWETRTDSPFPGLTTHAYLWTARNALFYSPATDADFVYGDGGWLVHANHFESPRLRAGDTDLPVSMSTLARAARARRLLSAAAVDSGISEATFRTILRDHAYGSYAICRHAEPAEPHLQQTATCASVIMNLSRQILHLAAGQPCQAQYREYSLPADLS